MNRGVSCLAVLSGSLFALLIAPNACAQRMTQEIELNPGWNAVYLQVDPELAECSNVVAAGGVPVEQICTYNDSFDPVQFVQNPDEVNPTNGLPNWLRWRSSGGAIGEEARLHQLVGGRTYLVHAGPTGGVWAVSGTPAYRPVEWRANAYNLVGFSVGSNVTHAAFLAGADAIETNTVYVMREDGVWARPVAQELMVSGHAFWVKTAGLPTFDGPLSVEAGTRRELDFGQTLVELPLRIESELSETVDVRITPLPSEGPAGRAEEGYYAGPVPLQWRIPGGAGGGAWACFTNGVSEVVSVPTSGLSLSIAVPRRDLPDFDAPSGAHPLYAGLLRVSHDSLLNVYLPVRAEGESVPMANAPESAMDREGLWVGDVVINQVSSPHANGGETDALLPVGAGHEFGFRVILHVDTNHVVRLLSHVAMLWENGTYGVDGGDDTPGKYRLIANDELLAAELAGSEWDSSEGRRLTAATFSHPLPEVAAESTTNAVRFVLSTAYDDPRSPYLHRYHRDHNNLQGEETGQTTDRDKTNDPPVTVSISNVLSQIWTPSLAEAACTAENFTVTRYIDMSFLPIGTDVGPEWGDSALGGLWTEAVTGLHASPIYVQGAFVIRRVVRSAELEVE